MAVVALRRARVRTFTTLHDRDDLPRIACVSPRFQTVPRQPDLWFNVDNTSRTAWLPLKKCGGVMLQRGPAAAL